MRTKLKHSCIGLGVLRATILTLICLLFYTVVNSFNSKVVDTSNLGTIFLIITVCSVIYGAGYAARKAGENGWIVGMLVGLIYIILIYIVSLIAGRGFSLELKDFFRILLCILVGTLSGMLGINL